VGSVWNGLVWFYKLFFAIEDIPQDTNGRAFKQEYEQKMRQRFPQIKLNLRFFERGFYELCERSRRDKKPILVIMLTDSSDETFQYFINALSNETAQELIANSYNVYGIFRHQVDNNLGTVLQFPPHATMSMWSLVVRHDNNISIISRLAGQGDEFRSESLINYLTENLNLFHIMCEEDPEYQREQIL
jgi:hypothetical protein